MDSQHPVKVLLVDSDKASSEAIKNFLYSSERRLPYEIYWTCDYAIAINSMLKCLHDVYLVSYHLSGQSSGLDLLHEAVQSNCNAPVFILGDGSLKQDHEALKRGAAGYFPKAGLDLTCLERAMQYALRQYKALNEVKSSETRFRIFFERSKDPIIITNEEGVIHSANRAALEYLEIGADELGRRNIQDFYRGNSREDLLAVINSEGAVTGFETEFISAGGSSRYCSISSFLEISQHGKEERYYSIFHDLTASRGYIGSALPQRDDTERIVYNIAKDIYNPLSNINFAIEELKTDYRKQEELVLLELIRKDCERINKLTSSLIAEITSRKQALGI